MTANISPHLFVLTSFSTAIASFLFFSKNGVNDKYFFIPMLALGVIYGIINLVRQYRGNSHFSVQKNINYLLMLKKSAARYVVWLVILFIASKFYELHPYYNQYKNNLTFFSYFFKLYLIFGLPYFFVTLIVKSSATEDFYDPAVRIIHIAKSIFRRMDFMVLRNKYNRKVLLNMVMRCYFIPIMVIQVYGNIENSIRYSAHNFAGYNFFTICLWLSAILWLTDILNASLSYCIESRWIENRSRSIDLTVGGWLVCLACYAPINEVTGTLFPFGPLAAGNNQALIIADNITFFTILKVLEIVVLVAHIYADVSLGPSVANITLKKLQTSGLYGIIRHPGTTFKLMLWWTQSVFYMEFWKPSYIFGHLMWNVLYILRAFTEERHLNKHKEYREYKKKTKHRFIPGIF